LQDFRQLRFGEEKFLVLNFNPLNPVHPVKKNFFVFFACLAVALAKAGVFRGENY